MNIKHLNNLINKAKSWDRERYGYIVMDWKGAVYFSNNIDCDGCRYWHYNSYLGFIEKLAVLGLEHHND